MVQQELEDLQEYPKNQAEPGFIHTCITSVTISV
jgi:hypothetical protein